MFLVSNPLNSAYKDLMDLAFDLCDEFILVVRKDGGLYLSENGMNVLNLISHSLIGVEEDCIWLGTEIIGAVASVYHYKTNELTKKIIKESANSLHDWVQPNLPVY